MYKVKEEDLIGGLKNFPIEIVQKMLECQIAQGNKEDISVFQRRVVTDKSCGGFSWTKTCEGIEFWKNVIHKKQFGIFFNRFPKQPEINTNVYFIGDYERGPEIIAALEALGGKQRFQGACKGSDPSMVYLIDNGIIGCKMKEYFLRDNPNSKELKLFPDKEIYFRDIMGLNMTKQQQIEQLQMQIQSLTDELKLKQQTIEDIQAKIEQDEADVENKQYQDFVKCNGILLERYVRENTDFMRESIVNVVKELSINAEFGECQYRGRF